MEPTATITEPLRMVTTRRTMHLQPAGKVPTNGLE